MTTPTPTRHCGVYTVRPAALPTLLRSAAAPPTLAVADPDLAARLDALPPLSPGPFRHAVIAEAASAAVPEAAVMLTAAALLDAAVTASGLLPPVLAAVQLPPTWIIGTPAQCAAVLAAAEAVTASAPGWRAS